ncbi:hypothetical protein PC128_g14568 [Phytophthora cactorum]|nr:hypothetical protein PC128_g14568 [Phytophthora cactorum]
MECSSLRDITILSNDDDNRTLVLTDLGPQGVIRVPAPKRCWPSPTHAQERLRRHSQGCFGERKLGLTSFGFVHGDMTCSYRCEQILLVMSLSSTPARSPSICCACAISGM